MSPRTELWTDRRNRFGRINVLVNNAAKQYMVKDFVKDTDLDMTEDLFQCNVIQMIALSKFALPHMKKGDSSVILFEILSST